ncbi:hypothetical protein [Rugosimonospora africana]|uniref:Uncharacterized protein n=1 Tax=Rugosimonospora africana TaxID=556532 RepID=A0A8J3VQU3_9ACTN|nr:hypothetical protein [Rugosimonospora africana]GIH14698.1 hypothetical protein Raf01_28700 [Rugosimonospora africana]
MTIYAVAVHHLMHTCPADPTPHPVSTTRTVVNVVPGRPCQTPVTIRCGHTTAVIPCGRHEPPDRQCGACRTAVTTTQITTTDLDQYARNRAGRGASA